MDRHAELRASHTKPASGSLSHPALTFLHKQIQAKNEPLKGEKKSSTVNLQSQVCWKGRDYYHAFLLGRHYGDLLITNQRV